MEHRLHQRESADLTVRLVKGGRVVATVQAIDMSSGGVGIETSGVPLHSGEGVAVDLCKPGHPRGISCCLSAMVIHTGPKTTGLMFSNEHSLHEIVHEQGVGSEKNSLSMNKEGAMNKPQRQVDVGSQAPEARTSPILEEGDEEFEVLAQEVEQQGQCYFNNVSYGHGTFVCSGSSEQLRCEKGIWVREGSCDSTNP